MDYEQSVVEFLAQPENLPAALEVARRVEQVKDHLQIRFWHMYRDEMQRRLDASDATANWRVTMTADKNLLSSWARCQIEYHSSASRSLSLNVALEAGQPRWNAYLMYGLRWSQKQPVHPEIAEIAELQRRLKEQLSLVSPSEWWLTYLNPERRLRDDTFVARFAAEPNVVVYELGEIVWTFFTQIREPLEAVNRRLSQPEIAA